MKTMKDSLPRCPSGEGRRRLAELSLRALLFLAVLLGSWPTLAAEVRIMAKYRSGVLTIEAPAAAYCQRWPELCGASHPLGQTLAIPVSYTKRYDASEARPDRDRLYVKMPGKRSGELLGATGGAHAFELEFLTIAQEVDVTAAYNPVQFDVLGSCDLLRRSDRHQIMMGVWQIRDSSQGCYSARGQLVAFNISVANLGAAYRLLIPGLKTMKPGTYSGRISYRIGASGDIDFGNNVSASDGGLDIVLDLTIERDIQVDFPPGSDRAVLEPPGGWLRWAGSRSPDRLSRDIPLRVTSEGGFGVYLRCQYAPSVDNCGLRNAQGKEVLLFTRLSLPGATSGGDAAANVPLPADEHGMRVFDIAQPFVGRPGTLHFVIERDGVKAMLEDPGSTYQGQVTVIFDARI